MKTNTHTKTKQRRRLKSNPASYKTIAMLHIVNTVCK